MTNTSLVLGSGNQPRSLSKPVFNIWSIEWLYFSLLLAAWCFTPFIRRYIDWKSGAFNSLALFSLVPYAMLVPLAVMSFSTVRLRRISPTFKTLATVWLGTFSYGLVLGIVNGNVASATFSFIQYVSPMVVGFWLTGQPINITAAFRRVAIILCVFGTGVAVYGIFQYISPPPWDVFWIYSTDFTSSGLPEPFQMRIFSTLNSAGPCADVLDLVILLALQFFRLRSIWVLPVSTALGAALMLTLVRVDWIALVIGVVVYILLSPRRLNAIPILGIFAFSIVLMITTLPTLLGADTHTMAIVDRLSTFNDINDDVSAVDRKSEISDAASHSLLNPIGDGLGTIGVSARLNAHGNLLGVVLDSGYLSRLVELGWIGFVGYCYVLFAGVVSIIRAPSLAGRNKDYDFRTVVATAAAMCIALIWLDAAADSHYGVDAVLFWIAMSLAGANPNLAGDSVRTPIGAKRSILSKQRPIGS